MKRFEMLSRQNGCCGRSFIRDENDYNCQPASPPNENRNRCVRFCCDEDNEDIPVSQNYPVSSNSGIFKRKPSFSRTELSPQPRNFSITGAKRTGSKWKLDTKSGEWFKIADRNVIGNKFHNSPSFSAQDIHSRPTQPCRRFDYSEPVPCLRDYNKPCSCDMCCNGNERF